jgi:hypothetical protein
VEIREDIREGSAMATDIWVGPNGELDFGGAAGSSDANWSLGVVPNSTDDAIISTPTTLNLHIENASENIGGLTLGANDIIICFSRSLTIDATGGGPIEIDGNLSVENGSLTVGENLGGSGNVIFDSGPTALGSLVIEGGANVAADGTGLIEMQILAATVTDSKIIAGSGGATFTNSSETISGDGQIGLNTGLVFINNATVQTNNSLAGSDTPGTLQITGSAGSGSFTNNASVDANNGGTLIFGMDGDASTIVNNLLVDVASEGKATSLQIAGNVTVDTVASSTPGMIALGGADAGADDQVVSDGHTASLTLVNQMLKGAGTVGDTNLTLNNASGTIESTVTGQTLVLNTGSNTITNGAAGLISTDGGNLSIDSPVENDGTMAADSDTLTLEKSVSGAGTIDIGQGSFVQALAQLSGNLAFTANSGVLELSNPFPAAKITSTLSGGNLILFTSLPYSSSMHLVWQQGGSSGALSVVNGNVALATVNIAGQYTVNDFSLFQDNGVATINLPNSSPPAATTADMIMRDGNNGNYEIYDLGNNGILAAAPLGQVGPEWKVAGVGAFDAPDTSDMILRNSNTGQFEIYDVSNNNLTGAAAMGQVGLEWQVAGFGDFSSRSGETDMLMRNSNTGQFEIYDLANNAIIFAAPMGQVGLEWSVVGFGDFSTRPNETDMLMRNTSTGQFEIYDISNNQLTSAASMGQVGLEWSVAGFGDFSGGANETDMLMRNSNTGQFEIYDIGNSQITSATPMGQVGLEWQVVGFGPIDGAGTSDMLMRNTNTGAFEIYDIANNTITNATGMGQVGLEWSVAGIAVDPPGGSSPANAQLAQAMASLGTSSSVTTGDGLTPSMEASQQTPLTTPQRS